MTDDENKSAPVEAAPPTITCNTCEKTFTICGHLVANFVMLAEKADAHTALETKVKDLETRNAVLEKAISDARAPLKWVVNHADRNNAHDMEHAKLALGAITSAARS